MNPILYAIPVFMLTVAFEAFWALRRHGNRTADVGGRTRPIYQFADAMGSLQIGVLSRIAAAFPRLLTVGIYVLVYQQFAVSSWDKSSPLAWLLALLLYDFFYYWKHRANHEVRIMWAGHITHHNSEYFNLSTALRQSSTTFVFDWMFYLPMAVLGVPPEMWIAAALIVIVTSQAVRADDTTELIRKLQEQVRTLEQKVKTIEGKEADARSDIWAFGAVLYEMVTGQKAFQGKSYSSLVGAILSADPPPMSVKPFTPAWLERLVRRCLQKDPEDRYLAMHDIALDPDFALGLATLMSGCGATEPKTAETTPAGQGNRLMRPVPRRDRALPGAANAQGTSARTPPRRRTAPRRAIACRRSPPRRFACARACPSPSPSAGARRARKSDRTRRSRRTPRATARAPRRVACS